MKRSYHDFSDLNLYCITTEDLWRYKTTRLDQRERVNIFEHLQYCARCRSIFNSLKTDKSLSKFLFDESAGDDAERRETIKPRTIFSVPIRLAFGQIWTTIARPMDSEGREALCADMSSPVLLLWPGSGKKDLKNIIRVIPISLDVDFAVKGEDVILTNKSPLKYKVVLTVWNESPMLAGNLGEYRGTLSDENLHEIRNVRNGLLSDKKKRRRYDTDLKEWRRLEMLRTAYLSVPVFISLKQDADIQLDRDDTFKYERVPVTLDIYSYQVAADAKGIGIGELHRTKLPVKSKKYSASIIQRRNELLLRIKLKKEKPISIYVKGEEVKELIHSKGLIHEFDIGNVESVREETEIRVIHSDEEHYYIIHPIRSEY
ncbi:MAG: hypothetical protein AB2L22_12955 [Syntrophales bacterium]